MKIYIVEDSAIIRGRIMVLLSGIHGAQISGMSGDVEEAYHEIVELQPDVIICDINLYGGNGIDLLKRIKDNVPDAEVLMLTNYPYPQYRERCMSLGADHFFDKSKDFHRIVDVISEKVS